MRRGGGAGGGDFEAGQGAPREALPADPHKSKDKAGVDFPQESIFICRRLAWAALDRERGQWGAVV